MAPPLEPSLSRTSTPGAASSAPAQLTNENGVLFFAADNGTNGTELWKSNGTAAGTILVKDIDPGPPGSYPNELTNVSGTLFFEANNGVNGTELWRSNGAAAGTVVVKDVHPASGDSFLGYFANVNGSLFFSADNGVTGSELWQSNGTAAGTQLVLDIRPGSQGSYPKYLTNVNGTLFFSANDGGHGVEPWVLGPVPLAPSVGSLVPPLPDVASLDAVFATDPSANAHQPPGPVLGTVAPGPLSRPSRWEPLHHPRTRADEQDALLTFLLHGISNYPKNPEPR